jgi:Tetracyclin repressor-like, C-terminal domain
VPDLPASPELPSPATLSWESPSSRPALRAVLDALVEHGYEGLTPEAIAVRAGPAAAALPAAPDVDELVITALDGVELFDVPPGTGSLRGDLRALLNPWRNQRSADEMAVAAVLSAAEWHPALRAAVTHALDRPLARATGAVLTRALGNAPQTALQTLNWVLRGLVLDRLRSGSRSAVDLDALADFLVAGVEHAAGGPELSARAGAGPAEPPSPAA